MRRYPVPIIILVFLPWLLPAQNLVPNPSFEAINNCPPTLSGIAWSANYTFFPTVKNWTNPLQQTSPDYFNRCAQSASNAHIPDNIFGVKETHTGDGMAGIIAWEQQYIGSTPVIDYREYIQTKLQQPLTAGRKYCVMFYASPAISTSFTNFNYVGIDQLGANLSVVQPTNTANHSLPISYDIANSTGTFISDTAQWYKIKGIYTAVGGEQWLTIGCFNLGSIPGYQQVYPVNPIQGANQRIYLFIDDVSVYETSAADTLRTIHDTTLCAYQNLNLLYSGIANADSYVWNNGATSQSQILQDSGTYWVRALRDCSVYIDTFRVHYKPFQLLKLGNDSVNCNNQPIILQPTSAYQSYLWSNGSTANTITVNQSGVYQLTVTDECGTQSASINVTIQPPTPAPVVSDTTICQGTKNVQLPVTGTNIRWYNYKSDVFGISPQPEIPATQPGKRVWYISQTIGMCESERIPLTVTVKYKPDADLGNYYSICDQDTARIGKEYPDVTYLWNTGEDICCIRPYYTGSYTLSIYNECGISSDSFFVDVAPCKECVEIPNAFSPNDDGRNDKFNIYTICPVRQFYLRIFDRWGHQVFASREVTKCWDGRTEGVLVAPGVYVYMLEYLDLESERSYFKKGNVTVVR